MEVRIRIKDRVFILSNKLSNLELLHYLQYNIKDIELKDNIWEIPSTVYNFNKLLNIIEGQGFKEFYEELLEKKRKEGVKEKSKLEQYMLDLKVKFPYLRDFQVKAVTKISLTDKSGMLLSLEQGLGKTCTAITSAINREENNVWIVVPASLSVQWEKEIQKWGGKDICIYKGSKDKRSKLYREVHTWNIISYETLRNDIEDVSLKKKIIDCFLILDESTKIKNNKSKVYKVFNNIKSKVKFKLFMTGTPVNNGLQDMHNVVKLIDTKLVGNINDYLIWEELKIGYGWNARIINQVVGYKNLSDYVEKVKPVYIRKTKEEVAKDLPSKTIIRVDVENDKKVLELKEGIIDQMSSFSGFTILQMLDSELYNLEVSQSENIQLFEEEISFITKVYKNPKLEVLEGLINEINNPVIIFTRFLGSMGIIKDFLTENYPKLRVQTVSASTGDKDTIREEFNKGNIDVVIATDTWSKGVDLANVDYMINWDIPTSIEYYLQRLDRIHRLSSTKPKFIYNLVGDVIENHIMDLLEEKLILIEKITEGKGDILSLDVKNEVIKKLGWKQ